MASNSAFWDRHDAGRRAADLVSRLTLEEKILQMGQYQAAVPRLGLAAYKHGTEAAHGVAWLGRATTFPQPTGLASTWNRALLEKVGEVVGTEARGFYARDKAVNGLTLWAPTVDLERDPRWGRTEEGYGEDPFLTGHLAGSFVAGLQGRHPQYLRTVATLKHFWGNNNEIDRGTCSTDVDEAQQRDYYLRSFEIAFRRYGAQSMMTAYNAVGGVPANLNPQVERIVRGEWGWKGFVVSDAGDVLGTQREHGFVPTAVEAVALSVKAGIDSITDDHEVVHRALREALQTGLLTEADLDQALKRTFRVRFLLGEFDPPEGNPYAALGEEVIGAPAHAALSREAAGQAVVLLRNDGLLPLRAPRSLAVVGPLADEVFRDWYSGTPPYAVTPLEGLKDRFPQAAFPFSSANDRVHSPWGELEVTDWGWGSHTLRHVATGKWLTDKDGLIEAASDEVFGWFTKEVFGVDAQGETAALTNWEGRSVEGGRSLPWKTVSHGLAEAVHAAAQAEVAIVVVGSHPLVTAKETLDRPDIVLPPAQEALVRAVVAANPNTVVVVVSGYPLSSPSDFGGARAVLTTSHAGQELGNALADVLSGDVNPAGRLPLTWYRSVSDLPPILDYDLTRGRTYRYFDRPVQFAFGHGLSYSRFEYADLQVYAEGPTLSFTLTNAGSWDGDEVVQVYLRALSPVRTTARLWLAGFERVFLSAGQTRRLTLKVPREEFETWNSVTRRRDLPSRRFEVFVGASSSDLRLSAVWDGTEGDETAHHNTVSGASMV